MQFFETIMGKRFFEGQLPRAIKAVERVADALEAMAHEKRVKRVPPPEVTEVTEEVPGDSVTRGFSQRFANARCVLQGYRTYALGLPGNNPWTMGTSEAIAWTRGWELAQHELG